MKLISLSYCQDAVGASLATACSFQQILNCFKSCLTNNLTHRNTNANMLSPILSTPWEYRLLWTSVSSRSCCVGDAMTITCTLPACWEGCHPTNPGGYKPFQVEMDTNHMAGKSVGKGMLQPAQLLQGECLSRALESHPTYPTALLN